MADLFFDAPVVDYADSASDASTHEAATVLPPWGYFGASAHGAGEFMTVAVIFPLMVVASPAAHGYWVSSPAVTSLQVTTVPAHGVFGAPPTGDDFAGMLTELADWTALSGERLAGLFGASRRSLYNWRRGASVGHEFAHRIVALHSMLEAVVREAGVVRTQGWLTQGEPPPLELLEHEQWAEFEQEARRELTPRVLERVEPPVEATDAPPAYDDAVLRAWHLSFLGTAGPSLPARRPDWRPKELTGAEPTDGDV